MAVSKAFATERYYRHPSCNAVQQSQEYGGFEA